MIPPRIVEDIAIERCRQADKHAADEAAELDAFVMLAVIMEELGEATQAALDIRAAAAGGASEAQVRDMLDQFRRELVETAASCVKAIAKYDDATLVLHYPPPASPASEAAEENPS